MKKTALVLVIAAMAAASSVQAEVSVNINLGVPAPRVMVASPPSIRFDVAPRFISPPRLGFYVGVDTPYDIIFSSNYYYLYYGNSWHRSGHYNGPWVEVPYRHLPPGIRKHRIENIRSYRDREYRVYRSNRDHYRGRQFRPDHERRGEWKEERRQDRNEWKNDRRQDRRERKEDKRDRRQQGHGRD
ncbi:MAG: hypothetical protein J0665_14975 [Deltaproteobacteria bacterium]|nr:hypothetical protein [Deltaproteobacteria bacterium]